MKKERGRKINQSAGGGGDAAVTICKVEKIIQRLECRGRGRQEEEEKEQEEEEKTTGGEMVKEQEEKEGKGE